MASYSVCEWESRSASHKRRKQMAETQREVRLQRQ